MLFFKRETETNTQFIGPIYENEYKKLIKKDKIRALSYLRRAALLLFPLKPELWDTYIAQKREVFHSRRSKKNIMMDLRNEMEDL